jgi:pyridoxal phosphate enzyme (YggS family)
MNIDLDAFTDNLQSVRKRIVAAARRAGCNAADIRLLAVTKTFPSSYIDVARAAGLTLFGENRVQEAQSKYKSLVGSGIELHLVGHLQRNKAKIAASLFHCVQSIDKLQTAEALNRHCAELGRKMDILLEFNTSGEDTKFGFVEEQQLEEACENITKLEGLSVRGLMTIGPFTTDRDRVRRAFARLRKMYQVLQDRYTELSLDTLSMGMSSDFEIAIEEGANLIRLGTVLFGPRSTCSDLDSSRMR